MIISLEMKIDNFYLGIVMFVLGIIYLWYSINSINKKMDKSDYFRKSILGKDLITSIILILGGLIYIFKYA